MNVSMFEPLLRDATIRAIDGVARKMAESEEVAETAVTRLLARWNQMEPAEKEHVVGIIIGTATTAVAAIIALRARAKAPVKTAAKAAAKKVAKAVVKKRER
jgi:chorismate mutase